MQGLCRANELTTGSFHRVATARTCREPLGIWWPDVWLIFYFQEKKQKKEKKEKKKASPRVSRLVKGKDEQFSQQVPHEKALSKQPQAHRPGPGHAAPRRHHRRGAGGRPSRTHGRVLTETRA